MEMHGIGVKIVKDDSLFTAENFKRCHLKDPNRSSCLEAAVVDALRKMGTTGW